MAGRRGQRSGVQDLWRKRDGSPSQLDGKGLRWRAVYVDRNGQQHTKAFKVKAAAQAWLDGNTAATVTGTWTDPARAATPFETVAEDWFATKQHRRPKTVVGYRSILDQIILPRWGEVAIGDIEYAELQRWISSLSTAGGSVRDRSKGLSASRVKHVHGQMRQVFQYAVRAKLITSNPSVDIELPTLPEPDDEKYLTHREVLALAEGAGAQRVATYVLAYTGLRFGELVGLRVAQVDLAGARIRVRSSVTAVPGKGMVESRPKNHQSRSVPVPGFLVGLLRDQIAGRSDDQLVFPGRHGGWMTLGEYRNAFDKGAKAAGVTGMTPHSLRHTAASLAIGAGANVKVVQRMLGHKTATMTLDRYGHLMSDDLDPVATALDSAYRKVTQNAA